MQHFLHWDIVFVHKTNVLEKHATFSANGTPSQLKEKATALYKEAASKKKRQGYKMLCLEPALAIIHRSDVGRPRPCSFNLDN
jgi:hypothetical protein